jgi:Ca2+-transporting ATPase
LLGLVGQIDPPRAEAKDAVARCRAAGIKAVMVTGDHKSTGHAIARELGIARDGDAAIDGSELELMSDAELADRIESIAVFARVHPAQKLRIVEAYQQRHEVVAMTGDGVNDAPALARADVGVAMGLSGTEVAKEAAKIVIGDDNFASIVAAVEEGRVVYRNIKKVVLYVFSTCLAEVLVVLIALLVGYPPPLAAVQILWIDLVTEGTVTVNLIVEPAEGDEMQMRPVPSNEPLLTRILLLRAAFMTTAITTISVGWYLYRSSLDLPFAQIQTETFTILAVCTWFNVLNCRSEKHSAISWSILQNPWIIGGLAVSILLQSAVIFYRPLGDLFYTTPLTTETLIAIVALASLVLWIEELRKFVVRRRDHP